MAAVLNKKLTAQETLAFGLQIFLHNRFDERATFKVSVEHSVITNEHFIFIRIVVGDRAMVVREKIPEQLFEEERFWTRYRLSDETLTTIMLIVG